VEEMLAFFERPEGESPYDVHRDLTVSMHDLVGIFRNEEDLERGLAKIGELTERAARIRVEGSRLFNPGWHLARDLKAMLTVSEAVARCALVRKESRGAHSRTDFPKTDSEWARRNNVVRKRGDAMEVSQRPLPEVPKELAALLAEAN
jgi:succinate dehydrogenase / fumarate reductase flavoprotein subunit